ncbi:unnamed protein product, partial [Rotaria sp. Silwood2]
PIQHEEISYVNKTDYSNKHIRTCQTTKHHYKLPMKINYRISSRSYTNQCKHSQRTICDTCIYNNIKILVENTINPNIICPELDCMAIFTFESIYCILRMGNNLELSKRYN